MALADTAKLVASLELNTSKFSGPLSKVEGQLGGFTRRAATLDKLGNDIGRGIRNTATNVAILAVAAAGALATQITAGVTSLGRIERINTQTEAAIASTGGAAGLTAKQIEDMAASLEKTTTIEAETVQEAENLLLTFTSIGKDIFPDATKAVLDMSVALGEDTGSAAIQLGKALQDPILGVTALRRVGVNFTDEQKKVIKALVETGDVAGAQQLILAELNKEFGGSAAAQADTYEGKLRNLGHTFGTLQETLATAFLPLIEKVADNLGTFLADPATIRRVEEFGDGLAAGLDTVIEKIGQLDFGAIGSALTIAGTGAKAVFDAFTGLPPWIQTAVLTGWGLNKLTGGALGSIAVDIGKLAFGGLRGATPANPVFVSQVGGIGGGGGAPIVAGGFGALLGRLLGVGGAVVGGALLGNAIARPVFDKTVAPAVRFEQSQFDKFISTNDPAKLQPRLDKINQALDFLGADNILGNLIAGDQIKVLQDQKSALEAKLGGIQSAAHLDALRAIAQQSERDAARTTEAARALDTLRGQANTLTRIEAKKTTVRVTVAQTVNVQSSATQMVQTIKRLVDTGDAFVGSM